MHTEPGRQRHRRWIGVAAGVFVLAGIVTSLALFGDDDGGSDNVSGTVSGPDRTKDSVPAPLVEGWAAVANSPLSGRSHHSMVWTGDEMIVWGGFGVASDNRDGELFADGAAYDPETDDWRRLPASPLEARQGHFAIWTGREVLIWGGPSPLVLADSQVPVDHNDGALYDPASKEWRRIPESPLSRRSESAVAYAAGRLLVWGGRDGRAPNDPGLA
ncbi:MAG: Kelch repeat-containing protein, partial [Acidimicrobiia bacterium]